MVSRAYTTMVIAVDATYDAGLRDPIGFQPQRFDAKLRQGQAEARAELRAEIAQFRVEMHGELGGVRTEMRTGFADLRAELLKWMFLFWLGTVGVTLASAFAR